MLFVFVLYFICASYVLFACEILFDFILEENSISNIVNPMDNKICKSKWNNYIYSRNIQINELPILQCLRSIKSIKYPEIHSKRKYSTHKWIILLLSSLNQSHISIVNLMKTLYTIQCEMLQIIPIEILKWFCIIEITRLMMVILYSKCVNI